MLFPNFYTRTLRKFEIPDNLGSLMGKIIPKPQNFEQCSDQRRTKTCIQILGLNSVPMVKTHALSEFQYENPQKIRKTRQFGVPYGWNSTKTLEFWIMFRSTKTKNLYQILGLNSVPIVKTHALSEFLHENSQKIRNTRQFGVTYG